MEKERLVYLKGFAQGLAGTVHDKTCEEARLIGTWMLELVKEVEHFKTLTVAEDRFPEEVLG